MTPRPQQEIGAEIVNELLASIRNQFYADDPQKRWFQDRQFILRRVVLWPATWLNKRGVTLPPERYRAILMDVFQEIKRHGSTGAVKYWPGYLLHCVQEHFKHHGDDYYEEGKSMRSAVEHSMLAFRRAKDSKVSPDPVKEMAAAAAIVRVPKRRPKQPPNQLNLFAR